MRMYPPRNHSSDLPKYSHPPLLPNLQRKPVSPKKHLESELWVARLGFCRECQFDGTPACADGIPSQFEYHPFRPINPKERADIRKRSAGRTAWKMTHTCQRFYMDFGFLCALTSYYSRPNIEEDRGVESFGAFSLYLLVIDEISHHVWVLLCRSKEPPIKIPTSFLELYGLKPGGLIKCDQGGELAHSLNFIQEMFDCYYIVELRGAASPLQWWC